MQSCCPCILLGVCGSLCASSVVRLAGECTWKSRDAMSRSGSWTLDVGATWELDTGRNWEPGSPTYLQIVDTGNRGSEENKERSRWCGDDGSGEVPNDYCWGEGGFQGQQRKRCPGSRDPSQCLRNLGEHMHCVPVGTNYNVCLPTCKDHETSDSGADRLDLKPSPLQIVPNHSTLLAHHSVDGHFGRSVYPSH